MSHTIAPTAARERIDLLDILRGFALLGILIVNMGIFSFPFIAQITRTPRGDSALDHATELLIAALATGKFYPLFAFLFGLGMWMQMERIQEAGGSPGRFMVRRLLVLMGFGLAHALLIWNGDILFVYALVGLAALLFRKVQPRTLLIWAGILIAIPIIIGAGFVALGALLSGDASGMAEGMAAMRDLEQRTIETYARGSWGQIFVWRAVEWLITMVIFFLFGNVVQILALFLIGMYFGKRQIFQRLNEKPASERRLPAGSVCLAVGLIANLALAWQMRVTDLSSPLAGLWSILTLIAGPVLSYGYLALFVTLTRTDAWRRRLQPLAAAGRMALSNYITQSIICTLIFYSYGLGLFGQVGAFIGLVISVTIWLVQLGVSVVWLKRFRFGPLEWAWRSLTYGKRQTMALPASRPSAA
ncbi:DUF418 domain-containing protein [Roseiflexus sp. RS-1]|uniref:DUF418 domain-containing protein n=1 Tax=Roseiflexus sp. (strain RS-1) TaxID=357808 RepID=UPI0000D8177C|nr:DUF418 domain-containing protein [Roseiflexus sp. RS-1]ABQ88880.1 protein of unknown function DUF418 [Roseiflexus sp. RS-1]